MIAFVRRHAQGIQAALLVAFLLAAFGPTLVQHVRSASDPLRFADDARILIPPLYRAEDPALFPHDPITAYYLSGLPDAHRLLYQALEPVVGPAALSKLLPYLLLTVALACLALAAHRLGGKAAVFGALALGLGSAHVLGRMVGGLPRAFALPVLLAGAACLVLGRPVALAALAVVAAAFYPVAGVLLGLSLLGLLLLPAKDRGLAAGFSWRRRAAVLALTALGMALVVLPSALRLRQYGPAIDAGLVAGYPEAGPKGRFDPVDRPPFPALPMAAAAPLVQTLVGDGAPLVAWTNQRAHAVPIAAGIGFLALLGWIPLARRRPEARRLLVLLGALVVAHTLALLVTPLLFLPERYVAYGISAVALLGVPTAFSFLAESASRALRAVPLVWNLVVLALVGARGAPWIGLTVAVPPSELPLYRSIERLPKTVVVAGWPGFAIDNVPYLARRTAFLTRETHMPFHARFTELTRQRMRSLIAAYFASDPTPLRTLRDHDGVTHLLVDRRDYSSPPPYFAPFDAETRTAFTSGQKRGFEVLRCPPSARVFEAGELTLLDLSRL